MAISQVGSSQTRSGKVSYQVTTGANEALYGLIGLCGPLLPLKVRCHADQTYFVSPTDIPDFPLFPCPFRQQEATSAIRGLEAILTTALADLQRGEACRRITVDVCKVGCYLMSTYATTIDGIGKGDPKIRAKIPDTDIYAAQSVLYRRLSANLYKTNSPGVYYHIHGSLDASKTLQMLALPSHRPDLKGYRECLSVIGTAVGKFSITELEALNAQAQQAGAPCLTQTEFLATPHGNALSQLPPFTLDPMETASPPVPFAATANLEGNQVLSGIKVLELCRVIAGPTIGRTLAAHGAEVLKVTSPLLPDVPFFQLDVNLGKHTTSLHLNWAKDRLIFEDLLADADVVIDGYRPGALDRMGYGPKALADLAARRGKGYVYISEDCFGGSQLPKSAGADWSQRPGWQQIADCVTGVAWEQGHFMNLNEPIVPPFPMSDYGTGALGCVAAMLGLYQRAVIGGSWVGRTSLVQYNMFLMSLGTYPSAVQDQLRQMHQGDFFDLRHDDSVDEVGSRALRSVKTLFPTLFSDKRMKQAWSPGFGGMMRWPREAISIEGLQVAHSRTARPNGYDEPSWHGWETDEAVFVG